jgi:hypothetical protein
VLTRQQDFEGYKIFRSMDQGRTWGNIITDVYGRTVGYKPIATFDIINQVKGSDPAYPQDLGSNSGLAYSYADSNLINGVEYWYCVTAYDHGNQEPDSLEQSYMYPLGASVFESHTIAAIPGPLAAEQPDDHLVALGGDCEGTVSVIIVDSVAVTGHNYTITFTDDMIVDGDIAEGLGFTLVDTTIQDTLFYKQPLPDESGQYLPVKDGFLLLLENVRLGVKSLGWTKVTGETCTFDWRHRSKYPNAPAGTVYQEAVSTTDDWRITIDYSPSGGLQATWADAYNGAVQDEKQQLPIRVQVVTDLDNPIDVSENTWLYEFAIPAPYEYRKDFYSPLGWDLEPGGKGYTAGSPTWYEKHVDFLEFEKIDIDPVSGDTIPNWIRLFTNNKPDTSISSSGDTLFINAIAPSDGDEFTITTNKPFRPGISYTFSTTPLTVLQGPDPTKADPLANVRVVPDPYIVTNVWETSEFGKKLQFTNLPSECTIKIFSLAAAHVATIHHTSGLGYLFWDMRNHNDQFIAPGVYLYAITTPDGDKALGRFLVIK